MGLSNSLLVKPIQIPEGCLIPSTFPSVQWCQDFVYPVPEDTEVHDLLSRLILSIASCDDPMGPTAGPNSTTTILLFWSSQLDPGHNSHSVWR